MAEGSADAGFSSARPTRASQGSADAGFSSLAPDAGAAPSAPSAADTVP